MKSIKATLKGTKQLIDSLSGIANLITCLVVLYGALNWIGINANGINERDKEFWKSINPAITDDQIEMYTNPDDVNLIKEKVLKKLKALEIMKKVETKRSKIFNKLYSDKILI